MIRIDIGGGKKKAAEQAEPGEKAQAQSRLSSWLERFTSEAADGKRYTDSKKILRFGVRWAPLALAVPLFGVSMVSLATAESGHEEDHRQMGELIAEREQMAEDSELEFLSSYREAVDGFSEAEVGRIDEDLLAAETALEVAFSGGDSGVLDDPGEVPGSLSFADAELVWDWRLTGVQDGDYEYFAVVELSAAQPDDDDLVVDTDHEGPHVGEGIVEEAEPSQEDQAYLIMVFTTSGPGEIAEASAAWNEGDPLRSWADDEDQDDDGDDETDSDGS